MRAKIRRSGDVTVVDLEGQLDFETAEPFRDTCEGILSNSKVVFNLEHLNFVGSSGIGAFVNTLRNFHEKNAVPPKFCHVRSEFRKIFKATETTFQIFENENMAMQSFDGPVAMVSVEEDIHSNVLFSPDGPQPGDLEKI